MHTHIHKYIHTCIQIISPRKRTLPAAQIAAFFQYSRKRQLESQQNENMRHSIAGHCAKKIQWKKPIARSLLKYCKKSYFRHFEQIVQVI